MVEQPRKTVLPILVGEEDAYYPVVIDTDARQIRYDNYNGASGEQKQLDRLLQVYAVEKAKLELVGPGTQ